MEGISFSTKTIVSPINKNVQSKSNIDYEEQQKRDTCGKQMMWDDAKGNPTTYPYGVFGFVHNGDRVEVHVITRVCDSYQRLESWSDNVGQTDRNVLMLTPKLLTIEWDEWIGLGAPQKVQGSTRIVGAHASLELYLRDKLNNVRICTETGEVFY